MLVEFVDIFDGDTPVIAPHPICDSCGHSSGPTFVSPYTYTSHTHSLSNQQLSDRDRAQVLEGIKQAEFRMLQLDKEIFDLKKILNGLQKKRSQLVKYKAIEKTRLSPISVLPDDVLSHLFGVCQQVLSDEGYIEIFERRTFVRTVTQVSSHWRLLAFSCPKLWTRIRIDGLKIIIDRGEEGYRKISSFIYRCISLSAELPLFIDYSERFIGFKHKKYGHLFDAIQKSSYRWKELRVAEGSELFMGSLSDNVLPCLKSLHVGVNAQITLPSMPLLANLSISMYAFNSYEKPLKGVPWDGIRNFDCGDGVRFEAAGELANVLSSMPNLVSLTLPDEEYISLDSHLTLPSLQSLVVDPNTLKWITAPLLTVLQITSYYGVEFDRFATIMEFLRRSNCTLTTLGILDIENGPRHLDRQAAYSELLQNVKTLAIPSYSTHYWPVESMGVLYDMLPVLETIIFLPWPNYMNNTIHFLKSLLTLRENQTCSHQGGLSRLKSVEVNLFAGSPPDVSLCHEWFSLVRDFKIFLSSDLARQSGVDIKLSYRYSDETHSWYIH